MERIRWNLDAFDRAELIRLTLEVTAVTTRMPCHMVELADFPMWVAAVHASKVLLRLRGDGRVDVTAGESFRGQYVTVHTTADLVRDVSLPSDLDGEWMQLPVVELWRLENLTAVTQ